MPALLVVENLKVLKDCKLGLPSRIKALAVHYFFFQRSVEEMAKAQWYQSAAGSHSRD
jgi:hypothetical protein